MNMTFWQGYGGIFTGLGILGTFFGLTWGLHGIDMTGGDIEVLKVGIKNLLSGVESVFVTSLVGIGGGLIYNGVHHSLLKNFHGKVQQLSNKLDENFPRRSTEDWLAEIKISTEEQTTSVKDLGEAVAEKICDGLGEKLDDIAEKICEAVENLSASSSEGIDKALSELAGEQMKRFAGALEDFTRRGDEIAEKNREAAEKFLYMLDSLSKHLDAATKSNEQSNRKTAEQLKTIADTNAAQIIDAVKAFREVVDAHNVAVKKMFDDIQKLLAESEIFLLDVHDAGDSLTRAATPVRQSTDILTQNLTATSAQMNTLAEANRNTRDNLREQSAQISSLLANYNKISGELERSIQTITTSLENYNGKMSKGLADALKNFGEKMNEALGGLNEIIEDFDETVGYVKQKRR